MTDTKKNRTISKLASDIKSQTIYLIEVPDIEYCDLGLTPYPTKNGTIKIYRVIGYDIDHLNYNSSTLIALSTEAIKINPENIDIPTHEKVQSVQIPKNINIPYANITWGNKLFKNRQMILTETKEQKPQMIVSKNIIDSPSYCCEAAFSISAIELPRI